MELCKPIKFVCDSSSKSEHKTMLKLSLILWTYPEKCAC